jgi:hypothetical protein
MEVEQVYCRWRMWYTKRVVWETGMGWGMKTFLKTGLTMVGLGLIGCSIAALAASGPLSQFLAQRMADELSRTFESDVRIEGLRVNPGRLSFELRGLRIDNPPPFKKEPALQCARIFVQPQWKTLFADTVELKQVALEGTEVWLRYRPGGTNLSVLRENAAKLALSEGDDSKHRDVLLRELSVDEIRAHFEPVGPSITVAPFTAKDLSEGQGASPAKIVSVALRTLTSELLGLKPVVDSVKKLLNLAPADSE